MSPYRPFAVLAVASLLASARASPAAVQVFPFQAMGAPTGPVPTGQLSVRAVSPQSTLSVLNLRGLKPNTAYTAHYHALGPASSAPCASQGPITLGFPAFKTNARGQATVTLRADPARIKGKLGAYVNVHTAADLAVVPLCAPLTAAGAVAPATPSAATHTVNITDNRFQPASLSVAAGTTVTWVHTGQVTHNVVSLDLPDLRSPDLRASDKYSYTFKVPGTYSYYCAYHDGMSATITVTSR